MINPTNPEHAAIIERLADRLAALSIGDTLAYIEANEIAGGRDIAGRYRYLMDKAREKAEKRLGCIFECIRSVGIKRLPTSECPEVGLVAIRRVRRISKRGVARLGRLSTNSLSTAEQKRVIGFTSMLGAIAMVADGNKARTVAAVADPARPIPPADILSMFAK